MGTRWLGLLPWLLGTELAAAQTLLRLGHTDQFEGSRHASAQLFARKVEQLSQGRLLVDVICCGKSGNDARNVELIGTGALDLTVSSVGSYASVVPSLNLMVMPYLVDDLLQGWKLYDTSKWLAAQWEKAPARGVRHLADWEAGFRHITTRRPVTEPSDTKGMVLRTFNNPMMTWTLSAMGFGVKVMPLSEVTTAIKAGRVDGQENPVDTIVSNNFHQVAPNVTLTRHVYSPIPLVVSEKRWQSLSASDRKVLQEAATSTAQYSRLYVVSQEERQLAEIQASGAKVITPDITAWRATVQPVYVKAHETYGADVDALLTEAAAVRRVTYRPLLSKHSPASTKP